MFGIDSIHDVPFEPVYDSKWMKHLKYRNKKKQRELDLDLHKQTKK